MTSPAELPDIFRYTDYRRYLRDWFDAKKAANPRFSHRLFARLSGGSSPSLLLHVVRGERNLTPATTEGFLKALGLEGDAADFFRALVDLDQAETDEARNDAWSRMSAQRRFREARRIEGDAFRCLSDWYIPAVRELAGRRDFRPDPGWIARTLRPPITEAQAAEALDVLRSLGLLAVGPDGRWRRADASVVTAPQVSGLAVHNYHRGMCERAREAVADFRPEERHLLGVTVLVPERLIPELKAELNAFQARLLDLCDSAPGGDRVYQLNLQLFPLSARPEDA